MYRPSPVPPRRPLRQNRVKTRDAGLGGYAGSLVLDPERRCRRRPARGPRVTLPEPCRRAFSSRLTRTCSSLSASAQVSGRPVATRRSRTRVGLASGDEAVDVTADQGGQVDQAAVQLEAARVDPGDVEQLGDQPGHPVGVGLDRLQHQPALVVGEPLPLGQQGRGEALDRCQRGAQLVGDGGDQLGPVALGAVAARGARAARRRPLHRATAARRPGRRTR